MGNKFNKTAARKQRDKKRTMLKCNCWYTDDGNKTAPYHRRIPVEGCPVRHHIGGT